ncbi:MAG: tRNA lysidine(34) synthetase TilS [Prevotella sp.]|nr:tRNA lysidine(34) synthetase TilS [Prevotella sp.]
MKRVAQYIAEHSLLDKSAKCLVALSGGADSVALLLILLELGYDVEAVHCNFHLRGDESDRDERFVADLCEKRGVALHRVHFDTRQYAALHKQSIELAARNLRYAYFGQLRKDIGAAAICVAHHRDDLVETVLMNLVRGTGIHGMVGIRPRNGFVVRPLLCVGREDIERYLADIGQDYVVDSTNLEDDATRNVFRHHIVPALQKINPGASDNIAHTAQLMTDIEKILDAHIGQCRNEVFSADGNISIPALLKHDAPLTILYELLLPYGFYGSQVADIMSAAKSSSVGRLFKSATHIAVIGRDTIEIGSSTVPDFKPLSVPFDGTYVLPDSRKLKVETLPAADTAISRSPNIATLDADRVVFPLTVRRIGQGDRFRPFGMKGTKLVSDFLTDIKCPYFERREQLAVLDATDTIVWLVGRRTSDVCRVSPSTEKVLRLVMSE